MTIRRADNSQSPTGQVAATKRHDAEAMAGDARPAPIRLYLMGRNTLISYNAPGVQSPVVDKLIVKVPSQRRVIKRNPVPLGRRALDRVLTRTITCADVV